MPFSKFSGVKPAAEELERAFAMFIAFQRPAKRFPITVKFIEIIWWYVEPLPFHMCKFSKDRISHINVEF
jgi:hypothetical protein